MFKYCHINLPRIRDHSTIALHYNYNYISQLLMRTYRSLVNYNKMKQLALSDNFNLNLFVKKFSANLVPFASQGA